MEQVGLRLFYALGAPAALRKAKSSHCGYPLLARTRLFKQQRPMEGLPCIAAIDAAWDAPRIRSHEIQTKVGNLIDNFTRQPKQYLHKQLCFK